MNTKPKNHRPGVVVGWAVTPYGGPTMHYQMFDWILFAILIPPPLLLLIDMLRNR